MLVKGGTREQGYMGKEVRTWLMGAENFTMLQGGKLVQRYNEVQVRVERGGDEVRPGAFSSAPTCTLKYTDIDTCINV